MDSKNGKNIGYGLCHIFRVYHRKEGYRKGYYRLIKQSLLYKKLEMDTKIRSQKISTKGRKLQNVCVCKNKTLLKNAGERDPGYSCYNACNDNEPKAYQCKEK